MESIYLSSYVYDSLIFSVEQFHHYIIMQFFWFF